MLRTLLRSTIVAAALAALSISLPSAAHAQCNNCSPGVSDSSGVSGGVVGGPCSTCGRRGFACRDYEYGRPDLFYNYYVPPTCGGMGAAMYIAPQPVPAYVGHTYYTYQPLMPHEMLYKHHRRYHRSYDEGRGTTRTGVIWW